MNQATLDQVDWSRVFTELAADVPIDDPHEAFAAAWVARRGFPALVRCAQRLDVAASVAEWLDEVAPVAAWSIARARLVETADQRQPKRRSRPHRLVMRDGLARALPRSLLR